MASSSSMGTCTRMCNMSMRHRMRANTPSAFNWLRWHSKTSAKLRQKCYFQANFTEIEEFARKRNAVFLTQVKRIWSGRDPQAISTWEKLRSNSMNRQWLKVTFWRCIREFSASRKPWRTSCNIRSTNESRKVCLKTTSPTCTILSSIWLASKYCSSLQVLPTQWYLCANSSSKNTSSEK